MALELLVLSVNHFDGKIPDELLSYENLTLIDLRANHLSQSIPINIGKLSKLETLILSSNYLTDWASRYSIAVGVAQGLSFLHGFASSPILLLDLSSKSIMLKSLKEPLVGDIEHYKVIDPSKSTGNFSAVAGSVGYIPPEYAYTMTVTMAGNVYSFGVILLELLTGKPAVTEGTELVKWVLRNSTNQDYILDFNVSRTSQAVRNQMLAILKIALVCVNTSPETRPKMKSVLRMLLNAR
ncbi:Leucine-rich repeat receptor tyrosine-protein kinase PXC3 [Spatholobus suberectus]|nr:Leucine-rich repeat receptor tyrosine-protein kinase PXC3 [Spatholobus suberectus]